MANDPQKTEKEDPRTWSPVVQQWEAFKAMKELITGPHEQVPESVLRNILSWQHDIKPEEVTWEHLRQAGYELCRQYGAVTIVPNDRTDYH
jgi:hypothetical protein